MEWNSNIPDIDKWQPRSDRNDTLKSGLVITCQAVQSRIIREAEIERKFNIDNYDSGPGLEDFVSQELSKLLPDRYSVDAGVVNDRDGYTAGDYEIVIRDRRWAPVTKLGATPESRRFHFPVESIYAAIELKQTLGFEQLDGAMEKLVKLSRLNRPINPYGHITENQHLRQFDRDEHVLNPLRTSIVAVRLQEGLTFRQLAQRFGLINSKLGRDEMVADLCVLAHGTAGYSVRLNDHNFVDATFMWDRVEPLIFSVSDQDEARDKVFYVFFVHLLGHLTRSVLGIHDISSAYGDLPIAEHMVWEPAKYDTKLR